jgi:sugar phosphate isomerase/epimerase
MNLAVSNIAWKNEEEEVVAGLMQELGLSFVEVAPTKLWDDPTKASDEELLAYKDFWSNYGIKIVAFQSMLFGREHLTIFDDESTRNKTKQYLKDFIVVAQKMGATRMVFGSPKNRQRNSMRIEDANNIAKEFFTDIADTAKEYGVVFCIEPNPKDYACDFVTNAKESDEFVRLVNHSNFKLHLDVAGMTLAGDDIKSAVKRSADILAHTHISAPMLGEVPSEDVKYIEFFATLNSVGFEGIRSIEMRPAEELNIERVRKAVEFSKKHIND